MTTIEDLRQMHDRDLRAVDSDEAREVSTARDRAATHIRVTLARCYGRPGAGTSGHGGCVAVCLTPAGTIGIRDQARGTAWDTGVIADPGVADLGLGDIGPETPPGRPDLAGFLRATALPEGWQQIMLSDVQGYEPGRPYYDEVPVDLYTPEQWIRPTLIADQLPGSDGVPRAPVERGRRRPYLDSFPYLEDAHGWGSQYPHGVPPWVQGKSVTVLDTIADRDKWHSRSVHLPRTYQARREDYVEARKLSMYVDYYAAHRREQIYGDRKEWAEPRAVAAIDRARSHLDTMSPSPWLAAQAIAEAPYVGAVLQYVWPDWYPEQ